MKFLIRVNAEYSAVVEADSEETAIAEAMKRDVSDWDQVAWSEPEVEEE